MALVTPFIWVAVAVNAAVLAAAIAAPSLVVPLAAVALLAVLAVAFAGGRTVKAGSVVAASAAPETAPSSAGSPLSNGAAPSHYDLHKRMASGSMGEIWTATHKLLGRDVAFKRIKPGNIDEEDTRRFEREARVLAKLQSPHTVEVFDFGVTTGGELFYAMELLDGIDLQTMVGQHGALPPNRVIYLLLQACASLHEAHEQGLVHRDIKPANFMICRYGGEWDFLKVLDFGLVKKPQGAQSSAGVTRASAVLGTPAYLAPESMGGSKFVDRRADLYALGAVGFWLLTGRMVFEAYQAMAMVRLHLTEPPPKASAHSTFEVPEALDALLLQCLAKKPEERPASADEVRRRLEQIPLAERWDQDRAAAWWHERPAKGAPS